MQLLLLLQLQLLLILPARRTSEGNETKRNRISRVNIQWSRHFRVSLSLSLGLLAVGFNWPVSLDELGDSHADRSPFTVINDLLEFISKTTSTTTRRRKRLRYFVTFLQRDDVVVVVVVVVSLPHSYHSIKYSTICECANSSANRKTIIVRRQRAAAVKCIRHQHDTRRR